MASYFISSLLSTLRDFNLYTITVRFFIMSGTQLFSVLIPVYILNYKRVWFAKRIRGAKVVIGYRSRLACAVAVEAASPAEFRAGNEQLGVNCISLTSLHALPAICCRGYSFRQALLTSMSAGTKVERQQRAA